MGEVFFQRERVDVSRATRVLEQRGEFAGEAEGVAFMKIIERLFAEAVAAAEEASAFAIVDDEGPHAVEALDEIVAPLAVGVEQDFGVGMVGRELAAEPHEFGAEFGVVVDFAIEGDAEFSIARPHRLRAAGDVDDREAAMAEENARVFLGPMAFGVGAAVADGVGHPAEDAEVSAPDEAG